MAGLSRTAVDQNQLVRHFLKSNPEVSEALIKEYLLEHPASATKLLRSFNRAASVRQASQGGADNRHSKGGADGKTSVTSRLKTTPQQRQAVNGESGATHDENTNQQHDAIEDDSEDVEDASSSAAASLDNLRGLAKEIVRKKKRFNGSSPFLSYNPDSLNTLASQHWQITKNRQNLDAALSQHRTYLQEVAALDENELFMELIRDVGKSISYDLI